MHARPLSDEHTNLVVCATCTHLCSQCMHLVKPCTHILLRSQMWSALVQTIDSATDKICLPIFFQSWSVTAFLIHRKSE